MGGMVLEKISIVVLLIVIALNIIVYGTLGAVPAVGLLVLVGLLLMLQRGVEQGWRTREQRRL
ncbi:MAG: hypothetical protein QXJ68_06065 [Methanocellales archaeon]